ncbi:hypothetical protein [Bacillus thuringiensis]|uniref:hypothetical protein n=1 Tax=Bacillus thuringiensis TaxID=1428 RepID=UPI003F539D28
MMNKPMDFQMLAPVTGSDFGFTSVLMSFSSTNTTWSPISATVIPLVVSETISRLQM